MTSAYVKLGKFNERLSKNYQENAKLILNGEDIVQKNVKKIKKQSFLFNMFHKDK